LGVQVSLEQVRRGEVVEVTTALISGKTHCQARLADCLSAPAFIPEQHRQVCLASDSFSQAAGAPALWGLLVVGVKCLPNQDQSNLVLAAKLRD
jgi:hypothetical protein